MVMFSVNKGPIWGETKTSIYIMGEVFMYFLTGFNFCLDVMRMNYKDFYFIHLREIDPLQMERDEVINKIIKDEKIKSN